MLRGQINGCYCPLWLNDQTFTAFQLHHPTAVVSLSWCPSKGDRTIMAVGQKDGGVAVWSLDSSGSNEKPQHVGLLWGHPGKSVLKLSYHPGNGN